MPSSPEQLEFINSQVENNGLQTFPPSRPRVEGAINIYGPNGQHHIRLVGEGFISDEISVEEWDNKSEAEQLKLRLGKKENLVPEVQATEAMVFDRELVGVAGA